MSKLLVQVLNEFKTCEPMSDVSKIVFRFPYESGVLEKRNGVVVDARDGLLEVELSDFEVQGLRIGEKQNFKCEIESKGHKLEVIFYGGLSVRMNGERKEIYEY